MPFANDDKTQIWDVEGARLIGVAAGPIQGMMDRLDSDREDSDGAAKAHARKPGARRWRLLMYFTDHTVLAFELGKRKGSESSGVGELIV